MRIPQVILFDFDYTLADSTAGAMECINHALVRLGYPAAERQAIRRCIAYPLPEVLARLTGVEDPEAAAQFAQEFISRADEVMALMTPLFPDVPATVATLRSAGFRTGIVSTKFRYRIQSILAQHDAGGLFDAIIGGEDVRRHKPHPECLERALAHFAIQPQDALYIGDHPVDAQAAAAAGVPFLAVLTGAATREDFAGHEPLAYCSTLQELLRLKLCQPPGSAEISS